jgi:hypothetical protein
MAYLSPNRRFGPPSKAIAPGGNAIGVALPPAVDTCRRMTEVHRRSSIAILAARSFARNFGG